MRFLVHSDINASTIQGSLGLPEYSYYFVLKTYVDVLRELGEVIILDDPMTQADTMYDEALRDGGDCVFISFAPPHRAPVGLRCPTVCVFAWEFSNLPDRAWDNEPRNDWRYVLRQHGRTISLSSYTADVVRETMGANYPVRAIPVPVMGAPGEPRFPLCAPRTLSLDCTVIDNRFYEIGAETFISHSPAEYLRLPCCRKQNVEMAFGLGAPECGMLGGFYEPEPWGTWSRIAAPWIMLPFRLDGQYRLSVELAPYGKNVHRQITLSVGGQPQSLRLTDNFHWHDFVFDFDANTRFIQFSGLDAAGLPDAPDPRGMGIGLRALRLERLSPLTQAHAETPEMAAAPLRLALEGVIYTSVLNPGDDRKNWRDMLTAFCFAFRNEPRATLILKMTHHSLGAFLGQVHYMLQRIGEVKCRILVLHGFLDDENYQRLVDASTYCINTSRCEGLCLPLMEYMSLGIPAVAPRHTAMLDYVNPENTFIIHSTQEPGIWPHDPDIRPGTLRHRIDWHSLVDACLESFRVAMDEPERYRAMSQAAIDAQREFCARDAVRESLAGFFDLPGRAAS